MECIKKVGLQSWTKLLRHLLLSSPTPYPTSVPGLFTAEINIQTKYYSRELNIHVTDPLLPLPPSLPPSPPPLENNFEGWFGYSIHLILKWPLFRYLFLFKLDLDASVKAKYSFEFSAQERGIKG